MTNKIDIIAVVSVGTYKTDKSQNNKQTNVCQQNQNLAVQQNYKARQTLDPL